MFGVLNVCKPEGWTSRHVVNRVQRFLRRDRCGHAGTLDPLATGVLVLCLGRATRLMKYVQQLPKTYEADFRLGLSSDTDDITGNCTDHEIEQPTDVRSIIELLPSWTGMIDQVPPQFSAVHINGKRAYELARAGQEIELPSRVVEVHSIELLDYSWPDLRLRIQCGSGTYVRSIGRDLGQVLGTGALMTGLRRTAIGPFRIEDAMDPETLDRAAIKEALNPAETIFPDAFRQTVDGEELERLAHGNPVPWHRAGDSGDLNVAESNDPILVFSPSGRLLAVTEWDPEQQLLAPRTVFASQESRKPRQRDSRSKNQD